MAAGTNEHKLRGVNHTSYYFTVPEVRSRAQVSPAQNQGASQSVLLPETLGENQLLTFSSFQKPPTPLGSWPLPLSSKPAKAN